MPEWVLKLARRLLALKPGRYQIILTIGRGDYDWTVTELGKVEQARRSAAMPCKTMGMPAEIERSG